MRTVALGVLASGTGTNLQAIIDRVEAGSLSARVAAIISDHAESGALGRAKKHGLFHEHVPREAFSTRTQFEEKIVGVLRERQVELVILAGFMRVLSPVFIRAFPQRIMNIHPSLLPSFPGLHGISQAFQHRVKVTGCTVHFVEEQVDAGPIIIQAECPILETDSEETLEARIHALEHQIYPEAIQLYAEGRLRIEGRKVTISESTVSPAPNLIQPAVRRNFEKKP
ncbi:MAG: phosphoribosylglycinamide formyltransferase [Nitrospirae bacterium]|nr:phosphoribosylglycinamide formyltransferase [Nitrospirota bacterium]